MDIIGSESTDDGRFKVWFEFNKNAEFVYDEQGKTNNFRISTRHLKAIIASMEDHYKTDRDLYIYFLSNSIVLERNVFKEVEMELK